MIARERFFSRLALPRRRAVFWLDVCSVLRWNGAVVLAAVVASTFALSSDDRTVSAFFERAPFFRAFALLLLAVLGFYIAVVVVPYIWFLLRYYLLRSGRNQILFKFPRDACALGDPFDVDAILQRKLRLVFGVIKFRLVFYDYRATAWSFLLRSQRRRGELFNSAERGAVASFSVRFPHAGRYRTRYSVVKFEDPFGFFSLPIVEKEFHETDAERNFYLYILPRHPRADAAPSYARRANVPSVSERRFKVAEDFFDSKRYEPTDDSRRMFWQVYAKNRTLLVRIPERDSVIDADVDLHVLFYQTFLRADDEEARRAFDVYVRDVGLLLDSLLRLRALTVTLVTDRPGDPPYRADPSLPAEENLKRALVSSDWHRDVPPADFFAAREAQRPPDRERILVVHPWLAPADVPPDRTAGFSAAYLLGTSALDVDGNGRTAAHGAWANALVRPERSAMAAAIRRAADRRRTLRLRANRLQLAARFREFPLSAPAGRA